MIVCVGVPFSGVEVLMDRGLPGKPIGSKYVYSEFLEHRADMRTRLAKDASAYEDDLALLELSFG